MVKSQKLSEYLKAGNWNNIGETMGFFKSGKVSVVMDGAFGSSGKGRMASYIGERFVGKWQFACHSFMSNAAHTVMSKHGTFMYQSLNSIAYMVNDYEKTYICGGAVLELEPLLKEIAENKIPVYKLGIHPLVAIVTEKDIKYERGKCNFDGDKFSEAIINENMLLGSTLHGVGAARARRILRRRDSLLARDVPELKQYLCNTREEIVSRLDKGQQGIMEIAQGFSLGYLEERFFPKVTSRNCSVAAALDDCGIPPYYLGKVLLNFRTFPIRVCSDKWADSSGTILKYKQAKAMEAAGEKITHIKGDSGAFYEDQKEITWDELTKSHNHKTPIFECSTLTENPRRVFTFSKTNLKEAIKYNLPPGGEEDVLISVNFANYIDPEMASMTEKFQSWVDENIPQEHVKKLWLIGYGPRSDQTIDLLGNSNF